MSIIKKINDSIDKGIIDFGNDINTDNEIIFVNININADIENVMIGFDDDDVNIIEFNIRN